MTPLKTTLLALGLFLSLATVSAQRGDGSGHPRGDKQDNRSLHGEKRGEPQMNCDGSCMAQSGRPNSRSMRGDVPRIEQVASSTPVTFGQTVRISRHFDGQVVSASSLVSASEPQLNPMGSVVVEITNVSQQAARFDVSDVTLWFEDNEQLVRLGWATHYTANGQNLTVRQQGGMWLEPGQTTQITVHYELRNRASQRNPSRNTHFDLSTVTTADLIFDFDNNRETLSRLS
jgi:hypothetical protein